jgi:hypothetical protein
LGDSSVNEPHVRDRGVHTDVVRICVIARGYRVLGRPVELDVDERLAAETADERARVLAVQLGL